MRRHQRVLPLVAVLVALSLALGLMLFQVVLKVMAGKARQRVARLALTLVMAKMTSSYEMTSYRRRSQLSL
jgi:ABC-type lipoprotein release transport system permease subunit